MRQNDDLLSYEIKLYKSIYENEQNYRNTFSDKAFKLISVIVAIIGADTWLFLKFLENVRRLNDVVCGFNLICVTACFVVTCVIVSFFFNTIYNYEDTRQNPDVLYELIENYKNEDVTQDKIMEAINKSLHISYIEAAQKTYNQNQNKIEMLRKLLCSIYTNLVLIFTTFLIEVLF